MDYFNHTNSGSQEINVYVLEDLSYIYKMGWRKCMKMLTTVTLNGGVWVILILYAALYFPDFLQ